jgi:hypothetical protein
MDKQAPRKPNKNGQNPVKMDQPTGKKTQLNPNKGSRRRRDKTNHPTEQNAVKRPGTWYRQQKNTKYAKNSEDRMLRMIQHQPDKSGQEDA